jgi:hypothetical protein
LCHRLPGRLLFSRVHAGRRSSDHTSRSGSSRAGTPYTTKLSSPMMS